MSKQMCYNIFGEEVPYEELLKASGQLSSKEEQLCLKLKQFRGNDYNIDDLLYDLEVDYNDNYYILKYIMSDLVNYNNTYNKKVSLDELVKYVKVVSEILMFKGYNIIVEELYIVFNIFVNFFKFHSSIEILTPHYCNCPSCNEDFNSDFIRINTISDFVNQLSHVDDSEIEETPIYVVLKSIHKTNGESSVFKMF